MKIYAIRDLNVGFNSPFVESGDAVAIRGFSYAMNNNDMMGFAPKDFDLYYLGEYDTEKGQIDAVDLPVLVIHGTEVFANDRT